MSKSDEEGRAGDPRSLPAGPFSRLEKAYNAHGPYFIELKVEPFLGHLHDDSRFADLLRRVAFE
jgi:hypothetical protein